VHDYFAVVPWGLFMAEDVRQDRAPMGRELTYADFTQTGWQDCANTFDADEYQEAWRSSGEPNDVGKVVRTAWGADEDQYKQWLSQADIDEILEAGLDLKAAYRAWRGAWQDCAKGFVKMLLQGWREKSEHARSR